MATYVTIHAVLDQRDYGDLEEVGGALLDNGACVAGKRVLDRILAGSDYGKALIVVSDDAGTDCTSTLTVADYTTGDSVLTFGIPGGDVTLTEGPTEDYEAETSNTVTATNLAAAINANETLSKFWTATSAVAVVTLTWKWGDSQAAGDFTIASDDPTAVAVTSHPTAGAPGVQSYAITDHT